MGPTWGPFWALKTQLQLTKQKEEHTGCPRSGRGRPELGPSSHADVDTHTSRPPARPAGPHALLYEVGVRSGRRHTRVTAASRSRFTDEQIKAQQRVGHWGRTAVSHPDRLAPGSGPHPSRTTLVTWEQKFSPRGFFRLMIRKHAATVCHPHLCSLDTSTQVSDLTSNP